jgi:glucose uptake protein GlcU
MIYAFIYVFSLVVANLLVAYFGVWFSIVNAFVLIGLDLSLRDKLHDLWHGDKLVLKMGLLILISSSISYALNSATEMIAIASFGAFALSMLGDAIAYHYLRSNDWFIRSNGSNIVGSAIDSVVFPTIAFGSLMPQIVLLQFIAKVGGGFIWSFIIRRFKWN